MTHAQVGRTATGEAGFTLIEVLLVVAIIGTVASIAVPGLTRAKAAANEASAIGSSRTVHEGQIAYSTVCGRGFYAETLTQLANGQYVSPELASGLKSGYSVALTFSEDSGMGPAGCDGGPTTSDFYWTATPLTGAMGTRSFALSAEGTIWQDTTGVTIVEPLGSGSEIPLD